MVRYPWGLSAVSGYRKAARHFGLHTLEDPSTVGTTSFRILVHQDVTKLRRAAKVLADAYSSDDDHLVSKAENWLLSESGVNWFAQDGSWWDLARDEGALECLGWVRSVAELAGCSRVTIRRVGLSR
jgi:hypothetical protein